MASDLLSSYRALAAGSSNTTPALNSIIDSSPATLRDSDRKLLVQDIINDVNAAGTSRLGVGDVALALLALKTMGRIPTGSEVIVRPDNLQILLTLIKTSYSTNAGVAAETLRCLANALLLQESGRDALVGMGGGEVALEILSPFTSSPINANPEFVFLSSRLLFLMTLKQLPFIKKCVEELRVVEIMAKRFDFLLPLAQSNQFMGKEALTDLLKFAFNILLQYPRMVGADDSINSLGRDSGDHVLLGELWISQFEPLLPALLRLFNGLPPTTPPLIPPLTHVVHALIGIPVNEHLAPIWFDSDTIPSETSRKGKEPERAYGLQTALSKLSFGTDRSSTSDPISPSSSLPKMDTLLHVHTLLDIATKHYFPGDPDDSSVRDLCKSEGNISLDDVLTPLVVLITRLGKGDLEARKRFRNWVLPADLDRSKPLEEREDLLGRCIRILTSVYFPRLKDAIGEMLFVLCDSDSTTLSGQIGYGNAAGFLFNKGMLAPPPSGPSTFDDDGSKDDSDDINPITGSVHRPIDPGPEMTDEEKEREAEKLFVLFDRLEKSGMVENPIRKAIQEGKLQGF